MTRPPHSPHHRHFALDPDVAFLNHGSFGACPLEVLAHQRELIERVERQPVRFFVRDYEGLLDGVRAELAAFIGVPDDTIVFVPNATSGVNAVLRSLSFSPGDELLVTSHAYPACRNALEFVAQRAGARVRVAEIPLPTSGGDEIVARIMDEVTERTKIALIDHVSSPTGLVMPLEAILGALADRGVDALVDGAHAPGMLELDVSRLNPPYYSGNCHKWLCAPKGAGFLHVRRDRQREIRPLTISHGASSSRTDRPRLLVEFDWTGTDDVTAYLSVGKAIGFMGSMLPGGWVELRRRNRELALEARGVLSRALGVEPPAPASMIGSLVALALPDGSDEPPRSPLFSDPLQDVLLERWGIEVPIVPWPAHPRRLVRVSAQIYNTREEYALLADALRAPS